ncbi:MAG: 3'-5' exonuclease [Cytophagales bacterium]|nr:3'-5' exonuclease [Cytophagales bacterium]
MNKSFAAKLKNILFIDIETAGIAPGFDELPQRLKPLWEHKAKIIDHTKNAQDLYNEKAGIYAEFGKIIVIGIGYLYIAENGEPMLKTKTIYSDNEHDILIEFKNIVQKYPPDSLQLCAHNGKEFDFPYIARRMLIHGIALPEVLQTANKKPWEITHIDTLEMWKFGDWKSYTSLELLAAIFEIPTSKYDIDGSKVHEYYYVHQDLQKIAEYCAKDVVVLAQLYLKMNIQNTVSEANIINT